MYIRDLISALLSAEELSEGFSLGELKSRKKIALEEMIEKSLRSIQEYNDYLIKSYTHHLDGVITEDEYRLFRENFRQQIDDAERNITHLRNEIERLADDSKIRALIERFKANGNITELNRRIVVGFVHSIIILDNRQIEVRFRYGSDFDITEYARLDAEQERTVG